MNMRSFAAEQGRRIKKERMDAGKTQSDAAKAVGVSASTIARWERGEHSPTQAELFGLAKLFKVPFRRLALIGSDADVVDVSALPSAIRDIMRDHVRQLSAALAAPNNR